MHRSTVQDWKSIIRKSKSIDQIFRNESSGEDFELWSISWFREIARIPKKQLRCEKIFSESLLTEIFLGRSQQFNLNFLSSKEYKSWVISNTPKIEKIK